jgi:hypothetical protein
MATPTSAAPIACRVVLQRRTGPHAACDGGQGGAKSCMIRLLPCARLARAQTERKTGEGKSAANMRIRYIPYWIFQLSRNLALRHNMVCLLYPSSKDSFKPVFSRRAFFHSDMHTAILSTAHFPSASLSGKTRVALLDIRPVRP